MMPAAKHFDPVVGVDIHIIQPPGPVPPVPVPHPFVGMIIDPFDYAPIIGATVKVNGLYRAIAGTQGKCIPSHIPIGGAFVKPPANECEMFMGSKTVEMDGDAASYMALPALSCQDIGAPPIPRLWKRGEVKSLVLPTSVVLPVPAGPPVTIGGPPTISLFQMLMKVVMWGLGKALKKFFKSSLGRRVLGALEAAKKKAFSWMKPGFLKCFILKAEPVNIISGEVVFGARDFALPGRIPLTWARTYGSRRTRAGLCGHGWETPADARLQFEPDGRVVFVNGDPGGAVFERLPPPGGSARELVAGAELRHLPEGPVVRTRDGLTFHFPRPRPAAAEVPLELIADPCGNRLRFERDAEGLRALVWDDGRRVEAECRDGRIVGLVLRHPSDPRPHLLVRYEYDRAGDLVAAVDALGAVHRYQYQGHRLVKHTNRTGLSFTYEYDGDGPDARCVRTGGDGGLYDYRFEYLDAAGEAWVTDSLGHVTVTQYDADSFPVAQIDALGGTTLFEYDAVGRATAVVAPGGPRTEFEYDEAGNLRKHTGPDGAATVFLFDERGRPAGVVSPGGRGWRWERDERGLTVRRTTPGGAVWEFTYNARGDLVLVTDPRGGRRHIDWDEAGLVRAVTDPAGRSTRVERNVFGRVAAQVGPDGGRTTFTCDPKGRPVAITYADGSVARIGYDAADNLSAVWDENGRQTKMRYFGLGRLAERVTPDGACVRYEYDTEERLVAVVNESGQSYRLDYDPLGRIVRETDYWGHAWAYDYGPAGRIVRSTDPLGRVTEYGHDARGRLTAWKPAGGSPDRFVWDPDGLLLIATNAVSTVKRAYDADGRLAEEVQDGFRVALAYDKAGNLARQEDGYGRVLEFARDQSGALTGITLDGEALLNVDYDAAGRPVRQRLRGGLQREVTFGPRGRLLKQRLLGGGRALLERGYRYDAAGHLVALADSRSGEVVLENDTRGRVRRTTGPGGAVREFARAADGSVLHESAGAPRTARGGGLTCEYDDAGQLVRRRGPSGEARLHWDGHGRLAEVATEAGGVVRFGYDALGRRVFKEADGRQVRFRWLSEMLLGEESPGGPPRQFVYWPGSFVPLAAVAGEAALYDTGLAGIPHALVGPGGRLAWAAEPDALAGVGRVTAAELDSPLRLQGQYFDAETGLCYNRNRYFDPAAARFISPDPLGLLAGPELYAYAPNVWNWIDPAGLAPCWSPLRAFQFAKDFFDRNPLLKRLNLIHTGQLGPMEREMEHFAEILEKREGMGIRTFSEDAYRAAYGRGLENPGKLVGDEIHMIEDVFTGPRGAAEVAHEYGASKLAQEFGGMDKVPTVPGVGSLTHILDNVGGFERE
jgi:RHS repeat-associated protein